MIFSFIIISVSVIITRLSLNSESVMLFIATRKPLPSATALVEIVTSAHDCSECICCLGWPLDAPNEYSTLPFQAAWGAIGFQPVLTSSLVGSNSTAMS